MARVTHFGWESKNDPVHGGTQEVARGRVRHDPSFAGVLTGAYSVSLKPQPIQDGTVASYAVTYTRFYLRIVKNSATQRRIFGVTGSEGGDDAVVLELTAAGVLKVYNWGNWVSVGGGSEDASHGELLGTSGDTPLVVGQWYRIEVLADFTLDTIAVKIDGTALTLSAATGTSYGIVLAGNLGVDWKIGKTGGSYCYEVDDATIDTTAYPGAGDIVSVGITGVGSTNTGWTTGGVAITDVNIQQAVTVPSYSAIPTAPFLLTSTTANADISFKLQTFAAVGITSVDTISGIKMTVSAAAAAGGTVKFYVSKNGSKTYAPTFVDYNTGQSCLSYYWPAADLGGLVSSDVVEVGLLKANNATATPCGGVHVDVETSSCTSSDATTRTVQVAVGTYAGTDATQAINCGFVPTFLMVYGNQGSVTTGVRLFWEGMYGVGGSGSGAQMAAHFALHVNRRSLAATSGFDAVGNSVLSNAVGSTYYWLAISDPSGYMTSRGMFAKDETNDTWTQPFVPVSFTPEMLWAMPLQKVSATVNFTARFTSHVSTLSSHLSASTADAANLISTMAAGTFTLKDTIDATNKGVASIGFQSTSSYVKRLCYITSYTGDATANRAISVTLGASLSFVMVVPTNNEPRFFKDSQMAAAESHRFSDDTTYLTAGAGSLITAMAAATFTVVGGASAGLNTAGVTYNVFALAAGTDTAPVTDVLQQADTGTTDAFTVGDTGHTYLARVRTMPFSVGNLNSYFGFKAGALLGSAGSKVNMKVISDFGLETKTVAVDMTAAASETHVLKQVDNLSGSAAANVQLEFADDTSNYTQWRLYQAALRTDAEE